MGDEGEHVVKDAMPRKGVKMGENGVLNGDHIVPGSMPIGEKPSSMFELSAIKDQLAGFYKWKRHCYW
jgi:hypothetical protein